jgi:PAS domain S-box-containing protein
MYSQRSSSAPVYSGGALEVLKEDGEFVLYRTWSENAEGQRQGVLTLLLNSEQPTSAALNRLTHEYELKDQLDVAWAVRPLELIRERGRRALRLHWPGGVPLTRLIGAPMEVGVFLGLAIALTRAVAQLHEHGLVHKDIKPANVFVDVGAGQAWLTGFGIASRLPRERQSPDPPEFIAGTLAYMAPEQTGRMNRSIDSRSDLYSLGVTLYQMLTGGLPFTAADPMEWVHFHIARRPPPPAERLESLPAPLSAIITKLLAKTAEERYQTAAGLQRDLRHCLAEWQHRGRIDDFPLGKGDTPSRLLIPEKLYGRSREIQSLLDSFSRVVASGTPELVLVCGYSGIGKSSVVNELHKVLVPPRGLFASGKFDQYKRDIPYATLAQAFQGLVRMLLGKPDPELRGWRDALREALGPNGLLIVDLIPELRHIIGEQPAVPVLAPLDAQRRFQLVFRRFLSVFARPEHPLALFLDDLQWLDTATLDFLEDVLRQPDVRHLMLVGAYRDNEVDPTHPLKARVAAIRATGVTVKEIVLAPLARVDLEHLLADSLRCELHETSPLATLVEQKTAGNPFFVIQFLTLLADEGLLSFEHRLARWSWDLTGIHAKGYTDNVVELMVDKLSRLSPQTRAGLQQLACLGNSAPGALLATLFERSEVEMHVVLGEAIQAGLVLHSHGLYGFLHDRVQEAAYSLIPEHLRAATHLRIGRLLLTSLGAQKQEEAVFEIVNQFNRGLPLIDSAAERRRVAELNLVAGKRAKGSSAYASALTYLRLARTLASEASWGEEYELLLCIEVNMAECELLTSDMAAADARLAELAQRARNNHDLSVVTRLRLTLYTTLDRSARGVQVCLEYLQHRGTRWSPHPPRDQVTDEYDRIWSQLDGRRIEELIELPPITDSDVLDTLEVLTEVVTPALFSDENLSSLVICHMVNLSLQHGNTDASCFAYVWLAIIAGPRFGNYDAGARFGRLGYELVEQRGLKRFQARTYMSYGDIVLPWTAHVRTGRELVRRAFQAANEIGDLTFAAYSRDHLVTNALSAGDPLPQVQQEAENGLQFAQKVQFGLVVSQITAQLGLIRTLRGLTPRFGSFNDAGFDELRFEQGLANNPTLGEVLCWYSVRKLQARFFAGEYAAAVEASLQAQRLLWTSPSQFETAEFCFYGALARAASFDSADQEHRQEHLQALLAHHAQLQLWAVNCAENFENRAALVGAEVARIEGRELDAQRLYEQAINSARANGFVHNEAVAYETAARFYETRGFGKFAQSYLQEARDCYLRWGADGKVRQLDQLNPQLRAQTPSAAYTSTIGAPVEYLDLGIVIKLSQAMSGEIVLEKLVDNLMRAAIEHAGAERGLLVLARGDKYHIVAEATTEADGVTVGPRQSSANAEDLPVSVLHYVVRTRETLLLHDASRETSFSTDGYIRQHHSRSILCLPLLKESRLVGMLYLENNLTSHVFTQSRMVVLKLLASQAAISLENIRLYGELREREANVRRLVDANIIGIFIWRMPGSIVDANEAFLRMVGYDREDLLSGRINWKELTPPEWRERDTQGMAELLATGAIQPYEKEYCHKDGRPVPVLIGCAKFEGERDDGVAFIVDLTDRKKAEQSIRESEQRYREAQMELARANRIATLGQMSASIAHEINQPVAATVTNAQAAVRFLDAGEPNLDEVRQALHRIVKLGNRVVDVIGRIRALAQKGPPRQDQFEINEAIQEVVSLSHSELVKRGVTVCNELGERLPLARADRVQLQQVVLNLLMNAVEAMSAVSERPAKLRISTARTVAGELLVRVEDSGPGLDPASTARIFDPFYSTKPGGLGIGLSICRSIIEAHEGRLWSESSELGGAAFAFTVPAVAAGGHELS